MSLLALPSAKADYVLFDDRIDLVTGNNIYRWGQDGKWINETNKFTHPTYLVNLTGEHLEGLQSVWLDIDDDGIEDSDENIGKYWATLSDQKLLAQILTSKIEPNHKYSICILASVGGRKYCQKDAFAPVWSTDAKSVSNPSLPYDVEWSESQPLSNLVPGSNGDNSSLTSDDGNPKMDDETNSDKVIASNKGDDDQRPIDVVIDGGKSDIAHETGVIMDDTNHDHKNAPDTQCALIDGEEDNKKSTPNDKAGSNDNDNADSCLAEDTKQATDACAGSNINVNSCNESGQSLGDDKSTADPIHELPYDTGHQLPSEKSVQSIVRH